MTLFERRAADPAATAAIAAEVASIVRRATEGGASVVVGLIGPLGAGKTTFVQGVVAALDPSGDHYVTSPTYAIAQTYDTHPRVTHLDLYRLGSLEELESIGYRELFYGAGGVAFVEWIDKVPEAVPDEWIEIQLAPQGQDVRLISIRPHGQRLLAISQGVLIP